MLVFAFMSTFGGKKYKRVQIQKGGRSRHPNHRVGVCKRFCKKQNHTVAVFHSF